MDIYFSGIESKDEGTWLLLAKVTNFLADPKDFDNIIPWDKNNANIILDSGAYRAFREGKELNISEYLSFAEKKLKNNECHLAIAPDVIGDPAATMRNWVEVRARAKHLNIAPVWQWGAPYRDLEKYKTHSDIVCIGGLVPHMRLQRKKVLSELKYLCSEYENMHLLGLNWLKAVNELADYNGTCDTSKWLDGARRGTVITFGNGGLFSRSTERLHLRGHRCRLSARNMHRFLDGRRFDFNAQVQTYFNWGNSD